MINKCSRCGLAMHPDLVKCEVCGELTSKEQRRKSKLFSLASTISISAVAVVVIFRTLTASEIAVGMSQSDCEQIVNLTKETRYAVESLSSDPDRAVVELTEASSQWSALSKNYVPGKFSWSTSGLEHNWLERLATATSSLALGEEALVEDGLSPEDYVIQLVKLSPRFCS